MKLPNDIICFIFSYYNCNINDYNITFSILKKAIQLNKLYYLLTKNSIYKTNFINAQIIAKYISEYSVYQKEYEYNLGLPWFNIENPILIDILFTNCNLPHSLSSYLYLKNDKIKKDIKTILNIVPKCVNSSYGILRDRTCITPLYAACINEKIEIEIIELLIQRGANIDHYINILGHYISILEDLRYNLHSARYSIIEKLFEKYNKKNVK